MQTPEKNKKTARFLRDPISASRYYWALRKLIHIEGEAITEDDLRFVLWYENALRAKPVTYGLRPFFLEVDCSILWFQTDAGQPKIHLRCRNEQSIDGVGERMAGEETVQSRRD
jgi:hypothetical protein